MDIFQKANSQIDYLKKIRQHIHQNPELGFKEFDTTALIREELGKWNIEMPTLTAETGVLGIIRGEKTGRGKVVALRADIDALPIEEQTGLPYASCRPGVMHACGHDGHTAVLLGVAKLLSEMRSQFAGTVKLIFQPAEEQLGGANSMIEAGVLTNPKPDVILALHCGMETPLGKVSYFPGSFMASADKFILKIKGVGAHGAYPHRGKDPIMAAAHVVVGLQSVVSREIDAIDKAVLSVCQFNSGTAFNIIPDDAVLCGSVRCHDKLIRESIPEKVDRIAGGIVQAFGCKHELEYIFGVPAVFNDPGVAASFAEAAKIALGNDSVQELARPLMGSEDYSYYLEQVPGVIFRLGINNGKPLSLHHPKFDFQDDALPFGVAAMTQFVLEQCQ